MLIDDDDERGANANGVAGLKAAAEVARRNEVLRNFMAINSKILAIMKLREQ